MKIIYLAAGKADLEIPGVVYQDKIIKRDLDACMLDVDLSSFDVILATPPCNYYSRARGNKPPSKYALETKHLLPDILTSLINLGKPFIVENVRSSKIDEIDKTISNDIQIVKYGRHTYWTNIFFNPQGIPQMFDFKIHGHRLHKHTQGGFNVNEVFKWWLNVVKIELGTL